jgi:hypothetical protein
MLVYQRVKPATQDGSGQIEWKEFEAVSRPHGTG